MGDELHMRSQATGNLLMRDLAAGDRGRRRRGGRALHRRQPPLLPEPDDGGGQVRVAGDCDDCAGSSVVSLISRNGTDVGIQLAGMPGRWFTAPAAPVADALLREGSRPEDAARDIGDSAVIECVGLGGMALAAAPVVASFFGGDAAAAAARTELMAQICAARSERFTITAATAPGRRWASTRGSSSSSTSRPRSPPASCTRSAGTGQIGAGVAHQPVEPFRAAIAALAAELDDG